FQVDIVNVVPVFFGLVDERHPNTFYAGVVERDIETAIFFDGFLNDRLHIRSFGDVRLQKEAIATGRADKAESFIAFGFTAAGEDDFGACFGEENGSVAADAGSSAGDECYFVLEIIAHECSYREDLACRLY